MADDKDELNQFLGKVDEIESLIKGLAKSEDGCIEKADDFLSKFQCEKKKFPPRDNTGVNRTVINQDAFRDDHPGNTPIHSTSQEAFLQSMEADAKERAERRKERERDATRLNEIGNDYFKKGDFKEALNYYNQAIDAVRDMSVLYTNRAQTHIKLGNFEDALNDCDWALRVYENCLKAHIHKGKAYLGLKKYQEAIASYEKAITIEPSKEKAITGYIREVHLAQQTAEEEALAKQLFDSGDVEAKGLVEILQRIHKEDQLPVYYSGGLRSLTQFLMNNASDKTLFRTNGGLNLTQNHPYLSKCFTASPRSLSRDEMDMCAAYIETIAAAVLNSEENQLQLLSNDQLPDQLLRFLESQVKHGVQLRAGIVKMLHHISQTDPGRSKVVLSMDLSRLLAVLFSLMKSKSQIAVDSASLLNNLAMDTKFRKQLRGNMEEAVLPAFENLMSGEASQLNVLPSCVSTMTNLCADPHIRRQLTSRKSCWEACSKTLICHKSAVKNQPQHDILYSTLGLIMNMTYEGCGSTAKEAAPRICSLSMEILASSSDDVTMQERCIATLGHLLPHSEQAVKECVDHGLVPSLLDALTLNDLTKGAIKCLVACTQHSPPAKTTIASYPSGLELLTGLLENADNAVVGNTALCLSHCTEHQGVSEALTKTDIIKQLLVLARDQTRYSVQQNCAVLIAKLCQGHPSHLERLRELHGIEILHDVLKKEKH